MKMNIRLLPSLTRKSIVVLATLAVIPLSHAQVVFADFISIDSSAHVAIGTLGGVGFTHQSTRVVVGEFPGTTNIDTDPDDSFAATQIGSLEVHPGGVLPWTSVLDGTSNRFKETLI